ncbi:MAG TPA: hypothetical protein VGN14_01670 [Candidatus Elarobacter sp.]|jgi:hypothetical protein
MSSFFTPILDTAIGLIVVYIAFSLLASWAGEQVSAFTQARSKMLVVALQQLLSGSPSAPPSPAQTAFFSHPIFTSLSNKVNAMPEYVSAQQFSAIVVSLVAPPAGQPVDSLATIQANANAIGIGPQVAAAIAKANGDYKAFVHNLEDWFDDHMDRVSGWYKVNAQRVLLAIGLILAVLWNVDSIRIVRSLSCNAALRGTAVTIGENAAGNNAFISTVLGALPIGWAPNTEHGELPLSCDDITAAKSAPAAGPWAFAGWLALKAAGLLATAVALSLGAPFWFDLLSRFTRVRQAGKKPDAGTPSLAG